MNAAPRTVRLFSAALAVAVGASLVMAKAHFNDELTRLTMKHDAVVLPAVEVVAQRPAHLAAASAERRAN
jgi:hypothetical protein